MFAALLGVKFGTPPVLLARIESLSSQLPTEQGRCCELVNSLQPRRPPSAWSGSACSGASQHCFLLLFKVRWRVQGPTIHRYIIYLYIHMYIYIHLAFKIEAETSSFQTPSTFISIPTTPVKSLPRNHPFTT